MLDAGESAVIERQEAQVRTSLAQEGTVDFQVVSTAWVDGELAVASGHPDEPAHQLGPVVPPLG